MEKVKKGNIVSVKNNNSNIFYSVEDIIKNYYGKDIAILKGITIRIMKQAYLEELMLIDNEKIDNSLRSLDNKIEERLNKIIKKNNEREENFKNIISGKILHLDGDKFYSEKSAKYYRKAGLNAVVKNVPENKQYILVKNYIYKYNPDILVLTGHDRYNKK